tara:strand:+ start:600 stop:1457 length:858 start_codon:yes stop_codon:yes gene_type:complete
MKTKDSETKVLTGSIIFLLFTAFLMTMILFTSCSENSELALENDVDLIASIESSLNKVAVTANDLPTTAKEELETNFSDDEIYSIEKVANVGFEVRLVTAEGSWTSELNSAFFDASGRFLEDRRHPRHGRRRSCFRFVFPFSVTMPDATIITLEDRSDRVLIRQWYVDNPDVDEKPTLVFPIEIEYQDGTVATINDELELEAARQDCSTVRCFDLVYPFTVSMPDGSTITLNSEDDRVLIRAWYVANPGVHGRPELVYPIEIIYQDGTIVIINDATELQTAKDNC